ncbi:MAG: ABC transporter ATP-binding protein/permease [Sphaerochaetaceae bacterium]|nr:ABC transporter ATP-binding protein/permease [Sphaerochaetaceae bacterium]
MFRLLKKYLKPYTSKIMLVMFLVVMQVVCEISLPTIMASVVDIGLANGDTPYILKRGGLMLFLAACQTGAMLGIGFVSSRVSAYLGKNLRGDIFRKAQLFSLDELNEIGVSSMIVRNTNDVTMLQNLTVITMRMVLVAPAMCIGSLIVTFSINSGLASVILLSVPFLILLFTCIIRSSTKLFGKLQKKIDGINNLLREHLSGARVIRAFVNQKTEQKRFEDANASLCRIATKVMRITSSMMPGLMMTVNLTIVAVCWFGAVQIEAGTMQVGQLMSFVQYVTHILMSLAMLSILMVILPRANVSAKRINAVLDLKPRITDPQNPCVPDEKQSCGTVEFRNVTFCYPGSDVPVLSDISFIADSGKTTAFVGSTGCGKTTLLRLVLRVYDVTPGTVFFDGQDVRNYAMDELRSRTAYVPQRSVLFSGTISDNLRVGNEDASDEELENALKTAQAWDFVREKEYGMSEPVSQGGKNVSGGQKQRLSIARAIVRDCEVYLFDDSFSALDYATDAKLRQALERNEKTKEKTRLVVAQRISTVMNADKIIVLEKGRIAGQGTHRELLETCPVYREIASSQLSEEELAL